MSGVKCYFVDSFPTSLSLPTLKSFVHSMFLDAITAYPLAKVVVIVCSENTTPLTNSSPFLTCKFQTKIIYTEQQFIEYFSDCESFTEYFPHSNEFGQKIVLPSSEIIQAIILDLSL